MSRSKGLGDSVEKFTKTTGLKSLMTLAFGEEDCGCNKRKQFLNKTFPYKQK
tara:strand:+ start:1468 stop:1623 length:156 start_codon:yes stop_codon:yes gene_type:complete